MSDVGRFFIDGFLSPENTSLAYYVQVACIHMAFRRLRICSQRSHTLKWAQRGGELVSPVKIFSACK